jgi:anaerobic selenocysteine-containing dehydrogenase
VAKAHTVYRTCSLCEATCGLAIAVEGDRIISVRGDDDDVFSHGFVCPKGTQIGALHEDPDRLREPLVRRNGALEEASWEEAFAAVERGLLPILERHGRNAVAVYLGNPNVHGLAGIFYGRPLLKALGTRNVFSASTVDQMPKHVSSGLMFGSPLAIAVPDLDRTDHLLMLGANPFASNGSLCTAPDFPGRLRALRKRGGKLVVVDPRRTRTAREADEHLFIRPGTDAAFLLSLVHVLFAEGRVSLGDVADHVAGADEIEALVEGFAPEYVADACGIDAEAIRRTARELAEAPSAAVYGRIGTHAVEFGTLASWAVDLLNVLTGNLDRPGGVLFPRPAHGRAGRRRGGRGFTTGRWQSRAKGHPEVFGELPVATLADEIETGGEEQVRALLTVAGNPVLSTPDSARLDRAVEGLDFMVSVDIYCNETTRHADVILPPPSPLARSHYDVAFYAMSVRNIANYSGPLFEADGPSEADILAKLTLIASGQGADADPKIVDDLLANAVASGLAGAEGSPARDCSVEEMLEAVAERGGPDRVLDLLLRGGPYGDGFGAVPDGLSLARLEAHAHGIDLGALTPQVPEVLSTPSAKIELAPKLLVEDLARLRARLAVQSAGLQLVGRRHVRSNNSWMHNLTGLVSGKSRCTLQVHPDDADRLSLADGALARVTSRVGAVEVTVERTADIMPGVVSLPHGWGHDAPGARMDVARRHAGVNSNVLTDAGVIDPLSGNAQLNGIPVDVEPVPGRG